MIRKIGLHIRFLKKVNVFQFFYLNYFCKSVIRMDNSKIIPYKHVVVDIAPTAKIYLCGGDIEIGCDLLRGSKEETRVRLREQAIWSSLGGCRVSYGSIVEILKGAILDCKYFTMNSNSTIIVAEKITLGQDVMIGRNVVIYDSDFHALLNEQGEVTNRSKKVLVGNHVWISANVMILKGSSIGENSVIGANCVVKGTVLKDTINQMDCEILSCVKHGTWSRENPDLLL